MIRCCWWRHAQKLWRHNLFFKRPLFQKVLGQLILLTSSKLQPYLWRQPSRNKKSEKNYKLCVAIQSISVFVDIRKVNDFRFKNANVSGTQEVSHVVYMFLKSSLGTLPFLIVWGGRCVTMQILGKKSLNLISLLKENDLKITSPLPF